MFKYYMLFLRPFVLVSMLFVVMLIITRTFFIYGMINTTAPVWYGIATPPE
jgi:hypothetical protein